MLHRKQNAAQEAKRCTESKMLHRKQKLKLGFLCMQVVRDKVVSNLATSLEKAAAELKKEGHAEGLPDATAVARAVEQALQTAFSMSHPTLVSKLRLFFPAL